ncbi:MAG TPA: M1 family metallopeptidase [Pedobacter sp.]|nr:M1 family metallopeptidase [Pedobacter sp.]
MSKHMDIVKYGLGFILFINLILLTSISRAQNAQTASSKFDHLESFAPFTYPIPNSSLRAADGKPSINYWQNRANYKINAVLDEVKESLQTTVKIFYVNNSTSDLPFIWLQVEQNKYSDLILDVQSARRGGLNISKVTYGKNGKRAKYELYGTRMKILLDKPIKSKGGTISFTIDYNFNIYESQRRGGILRLHDNRVFQIAQWYPRMCVYDDLTGWNTLPYIGTGEFYLEYGDFDVSITVPANHIVAASGALINPNFVLSDLQSKRLQIASKSDTTVSIQTQEESKKETKFKTTGTKTWKFKLINARDFAWASSSSFIWDAAMINLPLGKKALAMSMYPNERGSKMVWNRSTEFVKASIEFYSKHFNSYPYPVATNVAGRYAGMEYPGLSFTMYNSDTTQLWEITNHEFGHTWFPMIVGSDERTYAWMDEGMCTFISELSNQNFNGGEFYTDKEGLSLKNVLRQIDETSKDNSMQRPDVSGDENLIYSKPALGLKLLREIIIGKIRFDSAFREYIKTWAYKHPTPFDFFRFLENHCGENLNWFWRGWFYNNWKIDLAVTSITTFKSNRTKITLECLGKLPMPFSLEVEMINGEKKTFSYPVEFWQTGGKKFVFLEIPFKEIKSATIDPKQDLPDSNFENNKYFVLK